MCKPIGKRPIIRNDAFYECIGVMAAACFAQGLNTDEITHLLRNEGHDVWEHDVATALARWRDEHVTIEVLRGAELVA